MSEFLDSHPGIREAQARIYVKYRPAGADSNIAYLALLDTGAHYGGNSGTTHAIGGRAANSWGLYDMLGNVYEWCEDWYGAYTPESVIDPTGPAGGSSRVIRGGSWGYDARHVRAASRSWLPPGFRHSGLGFRLSRGRSALKPGAEP